MPPACHAGPRPPQPIGSSIVDRGLEAELTLDRPVDVFRVLGPIRRGRTDPTMRVGRGQVWRATRTPAGPATVQLQATASPARLRARAWGAGAAWAVDRLPALLGALDDDRGFVAHHPLVADLHRTFPGLRIGRTDAVFEALVPTILEQKVQGIAARRSYTSLLWALGSPAPG